MEGSEMFLNIYVLGDTFALRKKQGQNVLRHAKYVVA